MNRKDAIKAMLGMAAAPLVRADETAFWPEYKGPGESDAMLIHIQIWLNAGATIRAINPGSVIINKDGSCSGLYISFPK